MDQYEHCEDYLQNAFDGNQTEMVLYEVYPPVQEPQTRVLVVVTAFLACFVVGICGTSSVLTIIRYVVKRKRRLHPDRRINATDYTILYVAALCVVDFIVSLSLPPSIIDNIIGTKKFFIKVRQAF